MSTENDRGLPDLDGDLQAKALEKWGAEAQMTKLLEEDGELQAAISRWFLGTGSLKEVYEEVVGVASLLESLGPFFDEELYPERCRLIVRKQETKLQRALEESEVDS